MVKKSAKPLHQRLIDLPLSDLRQHLRNIVAAIGPNCSSARAYSRAIARKEAALKRRAARSAKVEASAPSNRLTAEGDNEALGRLLEAFERAVKSGNRQRLAKARASLRRLGITVTRAKGAGQ